MRLHSTRRWQDGQDRQHAAESGTSDQELGLRPGDVSRVLTALRPLVATRLRITNYWCISVLIDCFERDPSSGDLGQDVLGGSGPDEGFGLVVGALPVCPTSPVPHGHSSLVAASSQERAPRRATAPGQRRIASDRLASCPIANLT
jgi:hypothetical protein